MQALLHVAFHFLCEYIVILFSIVELLGYCVQWIAITLL
jgi:hypothetical protein